MEATVAKLRKEERTLNFALQRENIDIENIVGETSTQVLIEGTIEFPRYQSPVGRIISLVFTPKVSGSQVIEDAVVVRGAFDVDMLYEVEPGEGEHIHVSHYYAQKSVPFEQVLEIPGAASEGVAQVSVLVEAVEYDIVNPRIVEVDVAVSFDAKVITSKTVDIIAGIITPRPDEFIVSRESYTIEKLVAEKTLQSAVNTILDVSREGPGIDTILKPLAEAVVTDVQIIGGKVQVRGLIQTGLIYASMLQNRSQSIHLARHEGQIFEHVLALPGLSENLKATASVGIADIDTRIINEREVDLDVVVNVNARVFQVKELSVVTDIASELDTKIELQKTTLNIEVYGGSARIDIPVKGYLGVGEEVPPIHKVIDIRLVPRVTGNRLIEDRAIVEGYIEAEVIYAGIYDDDNEEVPHSFTSQIPFDAAADIEKARPGMSVISHIAVLDADYDTADERGIDIVATLNADIKVLQEEEIEAIIDAVVVESVRQTPGFTICSVQSEDTLWRLSKRYGVASERLLAVNKLSSEEDIRPGMKLVIPRRAG